MMTLIPAAKETSMVVKFYNFRNIVHFLKRILQVVDNAVFWQNVLLYLKNDPLSPSF